MSRETAIACCMCTIDGDHKVFSFVYGRVWRKRQGWRTGECRRRRGNSCLLLAWVQDPGRCWMNCRDYGTGDQGKALSMTNRSTQGFSRSWLLTVLPAFRFCKAERTTWWSRVVSKANDLHTDGEIHSWFRRCTRKCNSTAMMQVLVVSGSHSGIRLNSAELEFTFLLIPLFL